MRFEKVRHFRPQTGAAILEFAIGALLFLMLVMGAIVWGLSMWEINTLHYSIQRGARCDILPNQALPLVKECGTTTEYAARSAYALPVSTVPNEKVGDYYGSVAQDFSYTLDSSTFDLVNNHTYKSACVSTKQMANPFSVASSILKISPNVEAMTYCRSKQE